MSKVYVGDTGTEFILDCGSDITTATVLQIRAKKPSGAAVTWPAVIDGTQKVKYVALANDIDEPGRWRLQAYVAMPSWSGHGQTLLVDVFSPWE